MSNPWQQPFEDLREQQSVLSADALANYASNQMVYDPKTQKMVPKPKAQPSTTPATTPSTTAPATTPSTTTTPPSSTSPTTTPPATAPKPTSSATASTAEKIKGGLDVYKSQVASGNVKGAEETGKSTWALANPELAKREAERQRTRGTSATTNPLMQDMKSKMSAPPVATPSPAATPVPPSQVNKPSGEPTLLSKLSTPAKPAAKPQLGSARSRTFGEDSSNAIKGFLVREGYVREETAKRWWDDDGDGVGYEKGEVKGKFKKKKKK